MSSSRGVSPESQAVSGPRSRRSSLASVDTNAAAVGLSPSSSRQLAALDEDVIAAASEATGVDLVAAAAAAAAANPSGEEKPSGSGRTGRTTATARSASGRRTSSAARNNRGAASSARAGGGSQRGQRNKPAGSTAAGGSQIGADEAGGDAVDLPVPQQQPGLPGYEKRAARRPAVGMRLAAARVAAGVNQHEIAARCGIPINRVFAMEKGSEEDLEKWAPILAHVAIALGVPFSDIFGDYLSCTQNPHIVEPGSSNKASGSGDVLSSTMSLPLSSSATLGSGSVAGSPRGPAAPPPWKLTVGGRVRHTRERLKVPAELVADVLTEQGVLAAREEYDDLEMCDTTAEDAIPLLLYCIYRSGACLASVVL